MKVIGLTGGIGSGKTTVLKMFQKLGVPAFVADDEAKKLMNSDPELIQLITKLFGEKAYLNGKLNREYIASIVFSNKEKLLVLNNLVHPKVRQQFHHFQKSVTSKFAIYEAAILFESGTSNLCDYIITVTAEYPERIKRVMQRDKSAKEQVEARIKNQTSDQFRINHSHFVITNNNLHGTEIQVNTLFNLLKTMS